MKTRIFLLVAFLCCIFLTQKLDAQVDNVNYQIKYNADSCFYDAFFIVNSGSATSAAERTQFNSQYTIVVPTGTTVTIRRSYAPYVDNQAGGDTLNIIPWSITSSVVNPASLSGFDVKSVTVPLSPSSQYENLNSGDTVKIFSFTLSSITNCGAAVRLWNNATDPASDQPGMLNSDWSNGFTLGGIAQLYNDNSTTVQPPKPVIVNPPVTTCGNGIEIDLSASTGSCQTPLSYAWTGPNSYTSTSQDVSIVPATTADVGLYKVVVTDNLGCKDSITVNATNKPNAGADQVVCAGTTASISGTDPTTGTWAARAGNPTGATLSLLTAGNAQVTFSNAASGTYRYVYSTTTCSDTMSITVNPRPTVSITGSTGICIGATTTLSPTSGGTWASNNASVATVNATSGVVTAVAQGTATFTFTSAATGCMATTNPVTVNPPPTAVVTGTPAVCVGSTTTVSPVSGGTWLAVPNTTVNVTNAGVVTGLVAGSARLIFTETLTGCKSDSITITVTPVPTIAFVGNDSICVLSTTTLSPSTGGTWASSNPLVATINNSGLVTGLTTGTVTFVWTETSTGCSSAASGPLVVVPSPTVTASPPTICAGNSTTLTPTTGGTWTSNNTAVATITNGGVVTGVGSGVTFFTFTNTSTGCSRNTGNITVNPRPTVLAANSNICIGGTTTLTPSSGGTWISLETDTATVSGNVVTGVRAGIATLRFTEAASGCTNTIDITVRNRPTVSITGADSICISFTTQLSPTSGGSWASSNASIATVSNAGLVTGIAVGSVTFTFTDATTGCPSVPTNPVIVKNKPTVSISGSNLICVNSTTTLAVNPVTSGTWSAVNPSIATVHPTTGVVTAVAPGFARFRFTDATGCISDNTAPVTVNAPPAVSFTGPNPICVGFNTNVTPSSGGSWSSATPGVATINNAGLVTGISAGTSQLTFTQTSTTCTSAPLTVTISPKPTVVLTGDSPICIDSTSTVTPNSGGVWTSSAPGVATVTNGGIITGVSSGTAVFTFTSSAGCASDPIISIAVMPKPTVNVTGPSAICIGTTTQLSPSTGGTWASLNAGVATVSNAGLVTGVAQGVTQFVFTSDDGCVSLPTTAVTVNPKPIAVLNGPASICQGNTTLFSPTTGGSWTSTAPAVATITNAGIVTGVTVGTARFIFTNATTGCASDQSAQVAVTTGPSVAITDTVLCIGATTTVTPNSGGTWLSSNTAVATITNGGLVTAVGAGLATFTFRDAFGCLSLPTKVLTVNPRPTVGITGTPEICIGGTTQLSPTTGGTWASNHGSIATVTNGGVVSGVAAGIATFTFTSTATTCVSLPTDTVTVTPAAVVGFTGPDVVCVNGTTQLFPTTGGVWTSSDTDIATVTNSGVVTSKGPGKVTFTFTSGAGCPSGSVTDTLTVQHCFNPDFNATFVNVSVPGDVNTNDNVDAATTYGPTPLLISKPAGSLETLTLSSNGDGTYTFVANTEGVYIYNVPVCIPPLTAGCPLSLLTITVRNNISPSKLPVANTDFASTPINTAVTLNSLSNDRCVLSVGCTLDSASVTIISAPNNGATSINGTTGAITYTPISGFVGIDTLTYQVCVTAESGNCATAIQIITVSATGVDNTTVAADDFAVTPQDVTVTGNVKTNDSDAEGDTQTVTAQTTSKTGGTLTLLADGSYTFKPDTLFYGPVEFVYRTIDNNASPDTAYATLHILVMQDFTIKVRVYLEGAIMNSTGTAAEDGRPLMRDNLRVSPFTGARYIPNTDPYRTRPNNTYSSTFVNKFIKVAPGNRSDFLTIPKPDTVFAVSGQNAIVDWVIVDLRSKTEDTLTVATRSGLLQRDGDVVDLDGKSGLRFPGIAMDDYYVVVRHNRHLGVMTRDPQTPTQLTTLVNFTTTALPTFDFGTTHPTIGSVVNYTGLAQKTGTRNWLNYRALWAGDLDANGKVKYDNPFDDLNFLSSHVNFYSATGTGLANGLNNSSITSNFDFAYGYLNSDFDMNGKSKFDNPNDDKNMLYGQLIFYPRNAALLSNYDFVIEQLPVRVIR